MFLGFNPFTSMANWVGFIYSIRLVFLTDYESEIRIDWLHVVTVCHENGKKSNSRIYTYIRRRKKLQQSTQKKIYTAIDAEKNLRILIPILSIMILFLSYFGSVIWIEYIDHAQFAMGVKELKKNSNSSNL